MNLTGSPPDHVGARTAAIAQYCILLLSYVLMAADRNLFPLLAPDIRKEFGFPLANTGLLSTIFTLGLGIGGLPTGYLLSRFSRKAVLLTGLTVCSLATAVIPLSAGFWRMFFCLGVQGIGMAMLATPMFALATSYFFSNRAAAIGSVNFCYGIGGFIGPILASALLNLSHTWHVPVFAFGLVGLLMVGVIALTVHTWFSETSAVADYRAVAGGALTLLNRNTVLLTLLSMIQGLIFYGFLGMYPTFLREGLSYTPRMAGFVMGFFGLGALASIAGGWLGDRFSPRVVLCGGFLCSAILGYLLFGTSVGSLIRASMTFVWGATGSAILYVNLAAYHVKAVQSRLASRASGMFVTSLYGGAVFAGYLISSLASHLGWVRAGEIQMSGFAIVGALLALAVKPEQMTLFSQSRAS